MKAIFKFLALAFVAGACGAIATLIYHSALSPEAKVSMDLDYVDFITITLTALSLMITILGFFVAAASVIGWSTIENKLRDHSVSYFTDQLKKDGPLRRDLENLIESIAYEGIDNFKSQNAFSHPLGSDASRDGVPDEEFKDEV